ncbi:MAG: hypothetical protein WAW96_21040 [Alphaproteobacteria bacterium]
MSTVRLGVLCASFLLCAAAMPSAAKAETDACTLLTPAQVSAAVGFTVSAGTHVTPTFVATCTWTGSNSSGVQFVTLHLQAATFYDGAKKQASMMTAAGAVVKSAGAGDDSYYFVEGPQVTLQVKKGNNSIKVAVYKQIPVDQKETMELTLAKEVLPKL